MVFKQVQRLKQNPDPVISLFFRKLNQNGSLPAYVLFGFILFTSAGVAAQDSKSRDNKIQDNKNQEKKAPVYNERTLDSIKMVFLRQAAVRIPAIRQANASVEVLGKTDIDAKLYGNDLFKGKAQVTRIRADVNLPIITFGKNTVTAAVNGLQQRFKITDVTSYSPLIPEFENSLNTTTLSFRLGLTRVDSLFNRPFLLSAGITAVTDEKAKQVRINYLALAAITLKRTATTSITVGLIGIIDPSSTLPAFPYFSYWHKFNNGMEFFADAPSKISVRKPVSTNGTLIFGTELTGTLAFLNAEKSFLPAQNIYTTTELKVGPAFEYRISRDIILGVQGGLLNTFNSWVLEKNAKRSDYILSNKLGATPYINFTVSVLPFIRGWRAK